MPEDGQDTTTNVTQPEEELEEAIDELHIIWEQIEDPTLKSILKAETKKSKEDGKKVESRGFSINDFMGLIDDHATKEERQHSKTKVKELQGLIRRLRKSKKPKLIVSHHGSKTNQNPSLDGSLTGSMLNELGMLTGDLNNMEIEYASCYGGYEEGEEYISQAELFVLELVDNAENFYVHAVDVERITKGQDIINDIPKESYVEEQENTLQVFTEAEKNITTRPINHLLKFNWSVFVSSMEIRRDDRGKRPVDFLKEIFTKRKPNEKKTKIIAEEKAKAEVNKQNAGYKYANVGEQFVGETHPDLPEGENNIYLPLDVTSHENSTEYKHQVFFLCDYKQNLPKDHKGYVKTRNKSFIKRFINGLARHIHIKLTQVTTGNSSKATQKTSADKDRNPELTKTNRRSKSSRTMTF